ncbi:hypothetical protein Q1695_002768 [Nippostrongylus brasiliensis]|nr:hypothetical protein Q1695_002768 [Nippostrongylus brasiliensis]
MFSREMLLFLHRPPPNERNLGLHHPTVAIREAVRMKKRYLTVDILQVEWRDVSEADTWRKSYDEEEMYDNPYKRIARVQQKEVILAGELRTVILEMILLVFACYPVPCI